LDYLMLGTIFPSTSKPSDHVTLGAAALRMTRTLPIPVLAIGGINSTTIAAVAQNGGAGFAAIDYFAAAYRRGSDGLRAAVFEAKRLFDSSERLPKD
jgi:thiamine monophosphate synthase